MRNRTVSHCKSLYAHFRLWYVVKIGIYSEAPENHHCNTIFLFFLCLEAVAEMKHFELLTAALMKVRNIWGSGLVEW